MPNVKYILENARTLNVYEQQNNFDNGFPVDWYIVDSYNVNIPALAERDHDDDEKDWEDGRDGKDGRDGDGKDSKYGAGNKQKVEDDSAGALNDCDAIKNEVEDTTFENINECIAIAATDESVVNDGNGEEPNGEAPNEECLDCIEVFLDRLEVDFTDLTDLEEIAIEGALSAFGDDCEGDFSPQDVETLAGALIEVLGEDAGAEGGIVFNLEECLDAILEGTVV